MLGAIQRVLYLMRPFHLLFHHNPSIFCIFHLVSQVAVAIFLGSNRIIASKILYRFRGEAMPQNEESFYSLWSHPVKLRHRQSRLCKALLCSVIILPRQKAQVYIKSSFEIWTSNDSVQHEKLHCNKYKFQNAINNKIQNNKQNSVNNKIVSDYILERNYFQYNSKFSSWAFTNVFQKDLLRMNLVD